MINITPNKTPPPVFLSPAKANQMETMPITMQECKDFFDSKIAIFGACLKKQTNILPPSATNCHVTRPTTTRPLPAPSLTVTSSGEPISKELAVLQGNLKNHFPQNMASFPATKHTSTAVISNTIHPKIKYTDKILTTQFSPSKKHTGCTAEKMAMLKKSLNQPVRTLKILNRHFFQTYVAPIVHRLLRLE